jgi:manganese oxidase
LPNNNTPNTLAMEFNWLTMNGKSAPATTPLIIKQGERVRLRFVNIGMDHHPIHLHGVQFHVTGTEGGRVPESAWYPGNTVIVGVAQARDVEFEAKYVGDWMLHCHLPHHMMNQMVSMVGPMMMSHGSGSQTGKGIQEGMGVVRQGHALSEDLGPGFGRGMGMTTQEKNVSNAIGASVPAQTGALYTCLMHPEVKSDKEGKCPKCGMTLVKIQISGVELTEAEKKTVPGYPQDMMMIMDDDVAKPETYGLAAGWTASMMGMMTLVRVLPEDKYNEILARVNAGKTEKPQSAHEHKHSG